VKLWGGKTERRERVRLGREGEGARKGEHTSRVKREGEKDSEVFQKKKPSSSKNEKRVQEVKQKERKSEENRRNARQKAEIFGCREDMEKERVREWSKDNGW
jgi:hypothetical protein